MAGFGYKCKMLFVTTVATMMVANHYGAIEKDSLWQPRSLIDNSRLFECVADLIPAWLERLVWDRINFLGLLAMAWIIEKIRGSAETNDPTEPDRRDRNFPAQP